MRSFNASNVPDGFFLLTSYESEQDTCLVKVYGYEGARVVGFGVWDGAALMPLSDVHENSLFLPVAIVPCHNFDFES